MWGGVGELEGVEEAVDSGRGFEDRKFLFLPLALYFQLQKVQEIYSMRLTSLRVEITLWWELPPSYLGPSRIYAWALPFDGLMLRWLTWSALELLWRSEDQRKETRRLLQWFGQIWRKTWSEVGEGWPRNHGNCASRGEGERRKRHRRMNQSN